MPGSLAPAPSSLTAAAAAAKSSSPQDNAAAATKRAEDARLAKQDRVRQANLLRDAALICAQEAECEAIAASQQRDEAAGCARLASQRAAQEHGTAEEAFKAATDPPSNRGTRDDDNDMASSVSHAPRPTLQDALLAHEAAAVLQLHE